MFISAGIITKFRFPPRRPPKLHHPSSKQGSKWTQAMLTIAGLMTISSRQQTNCMHSDGIWMCPDNCPSFPFSLHLLAILACIWSRHTQHWLMIENADSLHFQPFQFHAFILSTFINSTQVELASSPLSSLLPSCSLFTYT